jgi:hypothetical protein
VFAQRKTVSELKEKSSIQMRLHNSMRIRLRRESKAASVQTALSAHRLISMTPERQKEKMKQVSDRLR